MSKYLRSPKLTLRETKKVIAQEILWCNKEIDRLLDLLHTNCWKEYFQEEIAMKKISIYRENIIELRWLLKLMNGKDVYNEKN